MTSVNLTSIQESDHESKLQSCRLDKHNHGMVHDKQFISDNNSTTLTDCDNFCTATTTKEFSMFMVKYSTLT